MEKEIEKNREIRIVLLAAMCGEKTTEELNALIGQYTSLVRAEIDLLTIKNA